MAESYPIREVMSECAEKWNDQPEPVSPFLAAAHFFSELKRRQLRYDTYLQTVITGGGHAYDPSLEATQAVERNIAIGLGLASTLHAEDILDLASSAEAAAMPQVNGWLQDDWMTFWPLVIAKPDLASMSRSRIGYLENQFAYTLRERIDYHGLNMQQYRDRSIDKSVRLGHYISHINAMHEMLDRNKVPLKPVWRTVGLVGIEESVGSTAEKFFAKQLGIRTFQAVLAKVEPLSPEDLADRAMGEQITQLRSLGVQALTGTPSQQFILVEGRQPSNWLISDPAQS